MTNQLKKIEILRKSLESVREILKKVDGPKNPTSQGDLLSNAELYSVPSSKRSSANMSYPDEIESMPDETIDEEKAKKAAKLKHYNEYRKKEIQAHKDHHISRGEDPREHDLNGWEIPWNDDDQERLTNAQKKQQNQGFNQKTVNKLKNEGKIDEKGRIAFGNDISSPTHVPQGPTDVSQAPRAASSQMSSREKAQMTRQEKTKSEQMRRASATSQSTDNKRAETINKINQIGLLLQNPKANHKDKRAIFDAVHQLSMHDKKLSEHANNVIGDHVKDHVTHLYSEASKQKMSPQEAMHTLNGIKELATRHGQEEHFDGLMASKPKE